MTDDKDPLFPNVGNPWADFRELTGRVEALERSLKKVQEAVLPVLVERKINDLLDNGDRMAFKRIEND